ncbi:Heavy metal-associated isoprenylated plant protein 41 [Linum perenne]
MLFNDRYSRSHRILLVGEGDFSFSASLAVSYGRNASNLVATSLDSLGFLTTNYTKARENIAALRARGCLVIHEMDATKMAGHWFMMGEKFDRIVFNFPFAGYFKEESSGSQIRLVR